MKVYFVRHGQTTYNARDIFQPHDSELSDLGINQAEFVAQRFKKISIDVILSSPLIRTKQTSEIITKVVNKKIEWIDELKEFKRPSEFIGKNGQNLEVIEIKKKIKEHIEDPFWHYSDEENFFDVKKRATSFLEKLTKRTEKNILCVTSGEILRMIIAAMLLGEKLNFEEYEKFQKFFRTINTGITICEKNKDEWKLWAWNDHAHLG